jgi:hypothetical protein
MLTKLCPCLLLLIFGFANNASAAGPSGQFLPGYYIGNTGDSVHCRIEYNDWYENPIAITVEVNNVHKTMGVADIKGFGVTGYGDFQTANVTYHPGPITGNNLPERFSDRTVTAAVFLSVLVRGPYSLYELRLADRPYYFIEAGNDSIQELVYRVKQADMEIQTDEQYKGLLAGYLAKEHLLDQDPYVLSKLTYSKQKFINLVGKLNEARTGVKASPPVKTMARKVAFELNIYLGGVLNSFPDAFATNFSTAKFPSSLSGAGGLGLRITAPGHFGAFSFGINLGYSAFKSSTTISGTTKVGVLSNSWYTLVKYTENPYVSNSQFIANLYFMYQLPGQSTFRPYAKLGFNMEFLLNSTGNVYSNWNGDFTGYHSTNPPQDYGPRGGTYVAEIFASQQVCANIAIGVRANRHALELAYYTPMELADNGQPAFSVSQFGLFYYYSILK